MPSPSQHSRPVSPLSKPEPEQQPINVFSLSQSAFDRIPAAPNNYVTMPKPRPQPNSLYARLRRSLSGRNPESSETPRAKRPSLSSVFSKLSFRTPEPEPEPKIIIRKMPDLAEFLPIPQVTYHRGLERYDMPRDEFGELIPLDSNMEPLPRPDGGRQFNPKRLNKNWKDVFGDRVREPVFPDEDVAEDATVWNRPYNPARATAPVLADATPAERVPELPYFRHKSVVEEMRLEDQRMLAENLAASIARAVASGPRASFATDTTHSSDGTHTSAFGGTWTPRASIDTAASSIGSSVRPSISSACPMPTASPKPAPPWPVLSAAKKSLASARRTRLRAITDRRSLYTSAQTPEICARIHSANKRWMNDHTYRRETRRSRVLDSAWMRELDRIEKEFPPTTHITPFTYAKHRAYHKRPVVPTRAPDVELVLPAPGGKGWYFPLRIEYCDDVVLAEHGVTRYRKRLPQAAHRKKGAVPFKRLEANGGARSRSGRKCATDMINRRRK
ncbi:hypothetical protein PLICRDRAFT_248497 [Plicaturopsis crispa FD-325 SS-3]|nr:hypothetical protein PLICRDRAFT_248497 [Plicaturopsis crispa FD-325 SS-3]